MKDIIRLNMPSDYYRLIDSVRDAIESKCIAFLLMGSWAKSIARPESDLDLLVVVENKIYPKRELVQILRTSNLKGRIDMKVIEMGELERYWKGLEHICIWSYFNFGILMLGKDLSPEFPLRPHLVRKVAIHMLESLEASANEVLHEGNYLPGVVNMLYSLRTMFFLQELISDNSNPYRPFSEIFLDIYGEVFNKFRRIEDGIRPNSPIQIGVGAKLHITNRMKADFSKSELEQIQNGTNVSLTMAKELYREVSNAIENDLIPR